MCCARATVTRERTHNPVLMSRLPPFPPLPAPKPFQRLRLASGNWSCGFFPPLLSFNLRNISKLFSRHHGLYKGKCDRNCSLEQNVINMLISAY